MKYYLKEMRVPHYIKNLLVFLPLICSGQFFQKELFFRCLWGFLSFCFLSSAIYFINDIKDAEKDRNHPTKCNRPIASGKIKIPSAIVFSIILLILSFLTHIFCFEISTTLCIIAYFLLNLAYSFGLKNIPLLDITILVSGFLIRVLYGSFVTNIKISNWLYLVIVSASFFLGMGKRRNEFIAQNGRDTRAVIKKYSLGFLEKNMYVSMGLIFVFYALWTIDNETVMLYQTDCLIWTVPIVMLIFMKYSLTIESNMNGDPVEVLLHDKFLMGLCVFFFFLMITLLYLI